MSSKTFNSPAFPRPPKGNLIRKQNLKLVYFNAKDASRSLRGGRKVNTLKWWGRQKTWKAGRSPIEIRFPIGARAGRAPSPHPGTRSNGRIRNKKPSMKPPPLVPSPEILIGLRDQRMNRF